jgi:hypothetical protein
VPLLGSMCQRQQARPAAARHPLCPVLIPTTGGLAATAAVGAQHQQNQNQNQQEQQQEQQQQRVLQMNMICQQNLGSCLQCSC